jgi:hypothetical protein
MKQRIKRTQAAEQTRNVEAFFLAAKAGKEHVLKVHGCLMGITTQRGLWITYLYSRYGDANAFHNFFTVKKVV